MRKKIIIAVLIWLVGTAIVIFSLGGVYSLLLGAALGPIENAWFIVPLASCFVGAVLVFYAYHKAAFARRWVKVIVLVIFILPVGGLGLLAGFQAVYVAAMPIFEDIVVIKRDVLFENGWHFVNSNSRFFIYDEKTHKCVTSLGTRKIVATLEVTLHYGNPSYFRVLKFGECKVQTPIKNPNTIVPAYITGEENNDYT